MTTLSDLGSSAISLSKIWTNKVTCNCISLDEEDKPNFETFRNLGQRGEWIERKVKIHELKLIK